VSVNLKSLFGRLNTTTRTALEGAAGLCLSRTNYNIEIEHFLLKLLDVPECDLRCIAKRFQIDLARTTNELNRSLDKLKSGNVRTPSFGPLLLETLVRGWVYGSLDYNSQRIRSGFVMIGLLAEDELSRLTRDASPTLGQIDVAALRRDFAAIVGSSVEAETATDDGEHEDLSGGPRVFISYRREEAEFYADVLFDRLLASVPGIRVFRDADTLQPGMIFAEKLNETISACDIVLALIGDKWLNATDHDGRRRIDGADDWVRLEIAAALRYEKTVVPCLIGSARMPARSELPSDLAGLEQRHAVILSPAILRRETEDLIRMLKDWRPPRRAKPAEQSDHPLGAGPSAGAPSED
jgi:hypothetical protein